MFNEIEAAKREVEDLIKKIRFDPSMARLLRNQAIAICVTMQLPIYYTEQIEEAFKQAEQEKVNSNNRSQDNINLNSEKQEKEFLNQIHAIYKEYDEHKLTKELKSLLSDLEQGKKVPLSKIKAFRQNVLADDSYHELAIKRHEAARAAYNHFDEKEKNDPNGLTLKDRHEKDFHAKILYKAEKEVKVIEIVRDQSISNEKVSSAISNIDNMRKRTNIPVPPPMPQKGISLSDISALKQKINSDRINPRSPNSNTIQLNQAFIDANIQPIPAIQDSKSPQLSEEQTLKPKDQLKNDPLSENIQDFEVSIFDIENIARVMRNIKIDDLFDEAKDPTATQQNISEDKQSESAKIADQPQPNDIDLEDFDLYSDIKLNEMQKEQDQIQQDSVEQNISPQQVDVDLTEISLDDIDIYDAIEPSIGQENHEPETLEQNSINEITANIDFDNFDIYEDITPAESKERLDQADINPQDITSKPLSAININTNSAVLAQEGLKLNSNPNEQAISAKQQNALNENNKKGISKVLDDNQAKQKDEQNPENEKDSPSNPNKPVKPSQSSNPAFDKLFSGGDNKKAFDKIKSDLDKASKKPDEPTQQPGTKPGPKKGRDI